MKIIGHGFQCAKCLGPSDQTVRPPGSEDLSRTRCMGNMLLAPNSLGCPWVFCKLYIIVSMLLPGFHTFFHDVHRVFQCFHRYFIEFPWVSWFSIASIGFSHVFQGFHRLCLRFPWGFHGFFPWLVSVGTMSPWSWPRGSNASWSTHIRRSRSRWPSRSRGKKRVERDGKSMSDYPLVNIQKAIENGHRHSWFTH